MQNDVDFDPEHGSHLERFRPAPPEIWLPYRNRSAALDLFSRDPVFIRLAQANVDPQKVLDACNKIATADPKKGLRDNGRQLQSARGAIQTWCQNAANAPSIQVLSDHWASTYKNIDFKTAIAAEEHVKSVATSFSPLNTDLQTVVAKITLIANQWAGTNGWRSTAFSLAHQIAANPKDAKAIKDFKSLFNDYLIPDLKTASAASTAARTKAASFASDLGGAVADVGTVDQTLNTLITALNILVKGDQTSLAAMRGTCTALEKAIPGLAIGGVVGMGIGAVMLDLPPPLDAIGGVILFGSIITELAAIGVAIAIAVIAGKMSKLQAKISSEQADIACASAAQKHFDQLVQGGGQVMAYANSFDTALNNVVSDYQSVLSEVERTNPQGPFLIQQIQSIDNAWSEVYQDGQTLKDLGIATEQIKRLTPDKWQVAAGDTPQSYLDKINTLAA